MECVAATWEEFEALPLAELDQTDCALVEGPLLLIDALLNVCELDYGDRSDDRLFDPPSFIIFRDEYRRWVDVVLSI